MEGKERISYAYNILHTKKITKTYCLPRFSKKIAKQVFSLSIQSPNCALLFLVSWERERKREREGERDCEEEPWKREKGEWTVCSLTNCTHFNLLSFTLSPSLSLTHTLTHTHTNTHSHLLTYLHTHEHIVKGPTLTGFFRYAVRRGNLHFEQC